MKTLYLLNKAILITVIGFVLLPFTATYAAEFTSDHLISKGGVLYPRGGDSTDTILRTPNNVRDILAPGARLGFLPTDCVSAVVGSMDGFQCHYGLFLSPESENGKTVYRVITYK